MRTHAHSLLAVGTLLLITALAACAPPNVSPASVPAASPTPLPLPGAIIATMPMMGSTSQAPATGPMPMMGGSNNLMGAALYQTSCAACHGKDRAGSKFTMDGQTIEVPELTWDDLNTMYQTDPSRGTVNEQLAIAITQGQNEDGEELNSMMPRWGRLTQAQVDSLIGYFQSPGASAAPVAIDLLGEQLYAAACAACHGQDGAGSKFADGGQTIEVPELSWNDLNSMYQSDPARGSVHDQLALAITQGQNEDGEEMNSMMPRWSILSQAQIDSLIEYIQLTFK